MVSNNSTNYVHFTYGTIGEMLMVVNFFEILHEQRPGANIIVLAPKNVSLYREMVEQYPFIQVCDAKDLAVFWRFFFLKKTVIRPQVSHQTPWSIKVLCRALALPPGSKVIAFTETRGNFVRRLFTDREVSLDPQESYFNNMLKLLPEMGMVQKPHTLKFDFTRRQNKLKKPYGIIHPVAGMGNKTLPVSRWVELIRLIKTKWPEINLYVTGSGSDAAMLKPLESSGAVLMCGQLSFQEIAQAIADAWFYLGSDTGVTHLASMIGVRVVMLGHNAYPMWLPSYNEQAIVLSEKKNCVCRGDKSGACFYSVEGVMKYRCLMDIKDEDVIQAVTKKIESARL